VFTSTRGGHPNLWELPLGGGAARQLTDGEGPDLGPAPTPDGRRLVFDLDVTSQHLIADQDGARRTLTTGAREILSGPEVSPDGAQLVAIRSEGATPVVIAIELASGAERTIADGNHAAFSPDGREIVYTAIAPPRLLAVPVSGGAPRELAALPGPVEDLAIGGDARVHVSLSIARREAWSVSLAGGDLARDAAAPIAMVVPGPSGARLELRCDGNGRCENRLEPGDVALGNGSAIWGADGAVYTCAQHALARLDRATGASTSLARACEPGFALSSDGHTVYGAEIRGYVRRMVIENFGDR
jgi:hypothetical protein